MKKNEIRFTGADLFWESALRFLKTGNPFLVLEIYIKGIEYNRAKVS